MLPFNKAANGAAWLLPAGSVGNLKLMPGMFVNSMPPVSSLIQNSEMADPAATLVNAALISSLLMPALTAAAMK